MNSETAHTELRLIADRLAAALHEHDDSHPALLEIDQWRQRHEPWVAEIGGDDAAETTLLDDL